MIIFRPHRASLIEAMEEAKEFQTQEEMKQFIYEQWHKYWSSGEEFFKIEDIVIDSREMNDERIGWEDARHVCIKRLGNENYIIKYGTPQCIGMCATKYRPLENGLTLQKK